MKQFAIYRGQHRLESKRLIPVRCKGFGSDDANAKRTPAKEDSMGDQKVKRVKYKGKKAMRMGPSSVPAREFTATQPGPSMVDDGEDLIEAIEFESRLKLLKEEAEVKKAELKTNTNVSILDGPNKGLYDSPPPPLSKTLLGTKAETAPEEDGTGMSKVVVNLVTLALAGILLVTSADLYFGSSKKVASSPQSQADLGDAIATELTSEQRKGLESRLQEFTDRLLERQDDEEALEGASVLNAQLGNLKTAEEQLEKLAKLKPDDSDPLRVLAEVQSGLGEYPKAIESYKKAWETSGRSSLEVLQGLANTLAAADKPQEAIDLITTTPSSSGSLGPVELGLLKAKVYSSWKGRSNDALAAYDELCDQFPSDFRPFIAKALYLKSQGRSGDAYRFYLEAKYLAPPSAKATLDTLFNR